MKRQLKKWVKVKPPTIYCKQKILKTIYFNSLFNSEIVQMDIRGLKK